MRIAIETNGLYASQAGVARYIRGLLGGLRQCPDAGMAHFELAWEVENLGYSQPWRALKTAYRELIWANTVAPVRLRQEKADLLHSTATLLIAPPRFLRNVLTLHDLAFIERPERFRRWHRWAWRRRLKRLPAVDRVICVSRFTADRAIRLCGCNASQLEVVYNGCEFAPEEPSPPDRPPEAALPSNYFLFVGSLEPGKNLVLLRAVYRLAEEARRPLAPLVIVGARWTGVRTEGPPPRGWLYLGRQPDAVLVHLYRRARALVFPSQYEGFGFPVLEAMALGCPVICSPVASLPEVGGAAARFAEAEPEAYLRAMIEIQRDDRLRGELAERGRRQARKFSWRRCAEETIRVYREVLKV